MKNLKWLSLNDVKRSIPAMELKGVSKVARGIEPSSQTNSGWVQAYIATGGSESKMSKRLTGRNDHETWKDRRTQFLSRHLAKVKKDNEKLWKNGEPTRRHLSLIAWGYSPNTAKLKQWLKTQPSLSGDEWKNGVKILKSNPKTITQFFLERNILAEIIDNTLILRIDKNSLAYLQKYSEELHIEIKEEGFPKVYVVSKDWDNTLVALHNIFY
jgi:hypothetical protein